MAAYNPKDTPVELKVGLICLAQPSELPIVVNVNDGVRTKAHTFHSPGSQEVLLGVLKADSYNTFLVQADKGWQETGRRGRVLGVRILVEDR